MAYVTGYEKTSFFITPLYKTG